MGGLGSAVGQGKVQCQLSVGAVRPHRETSQLDRAALNVFTVLLKKLSSERVGDLCRSGTL